MVSAACPFGVVSYWQFEEGFGPSASDSCDGNTGALFNNPSWTSGQVGGALIFNGLNFVNIFPNSNLIIGTAGTIEAWVQRPNWNPSFPTWSSNIIFSNNVWYQAPGSVYLSHTYPGTGLHFRYGGTADYGPADNYVSYLGANSWVAGSWHHVAATWASSGGSTALKLYADGQLVDSDSFPIVLSVPPIPWSIGRKIPSSPGQYHMEGWIGSIDEVAYYSVALTGTDINLHYQNGLTGLDYGETSEEEGAIPEFSTIGLVMAILIALIAIVFMIRKKK